MLPPFDSLLGWLIQLQSLDRQLLYRRVRVNKSRELASPVSGYKSRIRKISLRCVGSAWNKEDVSEKMETKAKELE